MKHFLLLTVITALPILNGNAQCVSSPYTPEWDWRGPSHYIFVIKGQNDDKPHTINYEPPWFAAHYNNLNINIFRLQYPKDYEPADGWVLVQRSFGTTINPVDNPYFILYNKYSGILRIFVLLTKTLGQNTSAVISLRLEQPDSTNGLVKTAVLENHTATPYRSALEDFGNQVSEIKVPNVYSNNSLYWLHADFIMNYDPCTCNNLSRLIFTAKFVTTATLAFTVNGDTLKKIDNTGNGMTRQSIVENTEKVVDAGNSFFTSAEQGIGIFNIILPGQDKKSDVKSLEAILPGLSAAVGVVDFLSMLSGASVFQRMTFDIDLQATGSFIASRSYKGVVLENPGSANSTLVPPTRLNYNNTMGIFNLLETPSVTLSAALNGNVLSYKCKLNNQISYIINPEPEFELDKSAVKIALVFEVPSSGFSDLILENNNLVDEGVKDNKRIIRTKFISAGCSADLSTLFGLSGPGGYTHLDVYVKVLGTFVKGNKTSVYVSKYKINLTRDDSKFSDSLFWPSGLSNIPDDTTPDGCTATITQGDPSAICNSTTNMYYKKSRAADYEYPRIEKDLNKEDKESAFTFYPNPAAYRVMFSYYLKEDSQVSLSLLNANGQLIAIPIHGFETGGKHEFIFDASSIAAGLYFIHFVSNGLERREKLVIFK